MELVLQPQDANGYAMWEHLNCDEYLLEIGTFDQMTFTPMMSYRTEDNYLRLPEKIL